MVAVREAGRLSVYRDMAVSAPYDIGAFESGRPDPRWPVAMATVKSINRELRDALSRLVFAESDADLREILAIAAPAIMITLLTESCVVLALARARERDLTLVPTTASLAADLAAGHTGNSGRIYDLSVQRFAAATALNWRSFARDLAHGFITNRGFRFDRDPVLVVNHNGLLQRKARAKNDQSFRYRSPGRLYGNTALSIGNAIQNKCQQLGTATGDLLKKILLLHGAEPAANHVETLSRKTGEWVETVAQHRLALDMNWRVRPRDLWTGTGGNYVTRQLRAAVRRSGGRVTGFEHGGGGHIHRELGSEVINEFWFADRFLADAAAKAKIYQSGAAASGLMLGLAPEFEGVESQLASFRWSNESAGAVKRVLYVTTAFVGESCYPIQPLMPDPIYADWQGRLADGLAAQGFEVLIKQHPQGLRRGQPLVTSKKGQYLSGSFEDAVRQADAFVFDYPATTTLWEVICTKKPVLFVDLGLADWNPEVRALFERRCAVVSGEFDEWNRPQADFAAMRSALINAPMDDAFATAYLTGQPRR
jgi:hypothetical protein